MYTVGKLAEATGWSIHTIYELATLDDPLPIVYAPGHERGGIVFEEDFKDWLYRTGTNYKGRKK